MNINTGEKNLRKKLANTPVADLIYYQSIESTNTAALDLIRTHASVKDWTLVYAEEQTAGRGRFDRRWSMQPGASLAFTLIFLPVEREKGMLQLISPLGALAVCSALEKLTDLKPQIKWPNDVLLNKRKMCGILAEASWQDDHLGGVALGIGINVLRGSVPQDGAALFPATSIETETAREIDRFLVLHEVLIGLAYWRKILGTQEFLDAWKARLAFLGETVRLEQPDGKMISGCLKGLTPRGDILLEIEDGSVLSFCVGDVRLRPVD